MGQPEHPNTIIVKNEFYPDGLTEQEIWEYYQHNKGKILEEVDDRDLIFFVMVDVNKPIVLRSGQTSRFIRLKSVNYNELITGRTISIHSTMKASEDIGIVDIDTDDFDQAKEAASDVYQYMLNKMVGIVEAASIQYTGKNSFHVVCNLRKKMPIDTIRTVLRKLLEKSSLAGDYTISGRRTLDIPNLDLAPNKYRGGFITKYSLSVLGLKCIPVPFKSLQKFKREDAKI